MADSVNELLHIRMTRRFDSLEFHFTVLLCENAFEKQHMEVNIQVQRTTKSLNVGDCACFGLLLQVA